jgi:hypothetical protein
MGSESGMLPLDEFEGELRRLARYSRSTAAADPLAAIVQKIVANPAFSESRLLTRLLGAVINVPGEFRFAEAAVFHSETLALIVSFLDLRRSGAVSDAQCRIAFKTVGGAEDATTA